MIPSLFVFLFSCVCLFFVEYFLILTEDLKMRDAGSFTSWGNSNTDFKLSSCLALHTKHNATASSETRKLHHNFIRYLFYCCCTGSDIALY